MPVDGLVAALHLRHNAPDIGIGVEKRFAQRLHRARQHRRPVDQRNERRVAPMIHHLLQPDLQRAELPALGLAIDHQEAAVRVDDRRDVRLRSCPRPR